MTGRIEDSVPELTSKNRLEQEIEWEQQLWFDCDGWGEQKQRTLQQRLVQKVLHHHKFLDFGPPPPRALLTLVPARWWSTSRLYAAMVALAFTLGAVITTLALLHK